MKMYYSERAKEYENVYFRDDDVRQQEQSKSSELRNTKIEIFTLIPDKNNDIYSVNFNLVDKEDEKFKVYHYSNCFSCEPKEEIQVNISKSTAGEWIQYDNLVYADRFFPALDILNQKGFFDNIKLEYKIIFSSGWNEERPLEGDYYFLENQSLKTVFKEFT